VFIDGRIAMTNLQMIAWGGFATMLIAAILLLIFIFSQIRQPIATAKQPLAAKGTPTAARAAALRETDPAVLIVWSMPSVHGKALAEKTAQSLHTSGVPVRLSPLTALVDHMLQSATNILFIVGTDQDGNAPADAEDFLLRDLPALTGLPYAILVLGSPKREGESFANRLNRRLRFCGALPLADPIEGEGHDTGALRRWQQFMPILGGARDLADWASPEYTGWRLISRDIINSGSEGAPMYHIYLQPEDALPDWKAGTIAEVYPGPADQAIAAIVERPGAHMRSPPLPHREYSVASVPTEDAVELVIRMRRGTDGAPGIGSRWLCHDVQPGQRVALRLRANPSFGPPADDAPIILIGYGSGIAGLLGHIKARRPGTRNWLIFGERNSAYDCLMGEEIADWVSIGHLERCDLVFSRDGAERRYVRHHLADVEAQVLDWILAGACIYVCGNLGGMATDVDAELTRILGRDVLDAMIADGRYRREVY
jgi:sulfite reductase (NADPH) flavoprotein alpha-component